MLRWFFLLATLSMAATALAAQDDNTCAQGNDERALAACSRLIASGRLDQTDLVTTYVKRGTLYQSHGNHDGAIADFTEVIRLLREGASPQLAATAYVARGTAYAAKGAHRHALLDFRDALAIDADNAKAAEGAKKSEQALAARSEPAAQPTAPAVTGSALTDPEGSPPRTEAKPPPRDNSGKKKGDTAPKPADERRAAPSRGGDKIALEPGVLKSEPPPHSMHRNQVVMVDDGSCPKGMIKRVVAGRHGRSSYCAPPR